MSGTGNLKAGISRSVRLRPLLVVLIFAACRPDPEPLPLPQRLLWSGNIPVFHGVEALRESSLSTPDSGKDTGTVFLHRFRFSGDDSMTLTLQEYRRDYWALHAFRKRAHFSEIGSEFQREGTSLIFQHGPFLGRAQSPNRTLSFVEFKQRLAFSGEDLFRKPYVFDTFPWAGRIPHSESVIPRYFLGKSWNGPVFCVRYACGGDTALAFRAGLQSQLELAKWIRITWQGKIDSTDAVFAFRGLDEFKNPLWISVLSAGLAGISGCPDSRLSFAYLEKMKKTAFFPVNP